MRFLLQTCLLLHYYLKIMWGDVPSVGYMISLHNFWKQNHFNNTSLQHTWKQYIIYIYVMYNISSWMCFPKKRRDRISRKVGNLHGAALGPLTWGVERKLVFYGNHVSGGFVFRVKTTGGKCVVHDFFLIGKIGSLVQTWSMIVNHGRTKKWDCTNCKAIPWGTTIQQPFGNVPLGYCTICHTGWWFQPIWKIRVKLEIFSK